MILDLEDDKHESKTVMEKVYGFDISADGKKIMVMKENGAYVVDAAADRRPRTPSPNPACGWNWTRAPNGARSSATLAHHGHVFYDPTCTA